jgi:hypothetical protein
VPSTYLTERPPDGWLTEYPQEVRMRVWMNKRRRAASLRLPPLASGKRDPWDLVARDAPSEVT